MVIDLNQTDAFINFNDGTTMDVGISKLPRKVKVGDIVDIDLSNKSMTNDTSINFF
ncbi:MAG TPA: hypothetical protein VIK72_10650 [Clostridiaceae bacterium]